MTWAHRQPYVQAVSQHSSAALHCRYTTWYCLTGIDQAKKPYCEEDRPTSFSKTSSTIFDRVVVIVWAAMEHALAGKGQIDLHSTWHYQHALASVQCSISSLNFIFAGRRYHSAPCQVGVADHEHQAVLQHTHAQQQCMLLSTQQQQDPIHLPSVVGMILCKTQQAMHAATAAASEAQRLMCSREQQLPAQTLLAAQMQQQSYLAAEAAMESAEQALEVAVRLLQDTQQLVLQHQHRGPVPAGFPPNAMPMRIPMPAQYFVRQQELDPELQDTCDSLEASNSMLSFNMSN